MTDAERLLTSRGLGDWKWWGFSQIHKWRWNGTHIDLGPVSIYNLKAIWFWNLVAFLILPLRVMYHYLWARKD